MITLEELDNEIQFDTYISEELIRKYLPSLHSKQNEEVTRVENERDIINYCLTLALDDLASLRADYDSKSKVSDIRSRLESLYQTLLMLN